MTNYKKMYTILCGAVDDVIAPLEKIPLARNCVQHLKNALLEAEEVYIITSPLEEPTDPEEIAKIDSAWDDWVDNYAPEEDRAAFREATMRRRGERNQR